MWTGAFISQAGTQMQVLAQSWTVFTLSKDNSFFLGVDQFLGVMPIVILSLVAGVLADRMDRRRILLSSQYTQMACAFTMATLAYTGVLQVWHIWMLSFIVGTAQAFGGPSYSALVPTLVPKEHLPNAIALNSIQFNLARVVGPSLSGIALTAAGAALCFGMNGLSFLVVIASLYMVNVRFLPQKSTEPVLSAMKQGFGFVANRPGMRPLIVLSFTITFLGFQIMAFLPPMARELHGGSTTVAFLSVSSAVGAVTGALIVAAIGRTKHQGRNSLLALMSLGLVTVGYALAPNLLVACGLLFLAGIALMAVFNMNTSLVQMLAPDDMRGRVMSVYNLSVRGGQALGPLIAGSLITNYGLGPRNVIAGCGALLLCVGLYLFTFNRRITEL